MKIFSKSGMICPSKGIEPHGQLKYIHALMNDPRLVRWAFEKFLVHMDDHPIAFPKNKNKMNPFTIIPLDALVLSSCLSTTPSFSFQRPKRQIGFTLDHPVATFFYDKSIFQAECEIQGLSPKSEYNIYQYSISGLYRWYEVNG